MKRTLLTFTAALVLVFALAGCTSRNSTGDTADSSLIGDETYAADENGVTNQNGDDGTTTVTDGTDRTDDGDLADDVRGAVDDAGDVVDDIANGAADAVDDAADAVDDVTGAPQKRVARPSDRPSAA